MAPKSKTGFASKEEYLAFLAAERPRRGDAWYQQKLNEAELRDKARGEKRRVSDQSWRQAIKVWGNNPASIQQVAEALDLGEFEKPSKVHRRYKSVHGSNSLLLNMEDGRFWFMDGAGLKSLRGRASGKGVLSLAIAVKEVGGAANYYHEAKGTLVALSGIAPPDFHMSESEMAALKAKIEAAKAQTPAAPIERVEEPIDPKIIPKPITDPKRIAEIRAIVAKERAMPEDYIERLEKEGVIVYGISPYSHKPEVGSPLRGFETGKLVAWSSRKIKAFDNSEPKGICQGMVTYGATEIGKWSDDVKEVKLFEGVYDGAAVRLMDERAGLDTSKIMYMALSGVRVPEYLIQSAARKGLKLVGCFDNDIAGRRMQQRMEEECQKVNCQYSAIRIPKGEVDIAIKDTVAGREIYRRLIEGCQNDQTAFTVLPSKDGGLRATAATNDKSCHLLDTLRNEVHVARKGGKDSVDMDMRWHRKDFNELLQREYLPKNRSTSGLPVKDETQTTAAREHLIRRHGIAGAVADQLMTGNQVYASQGYMIIPLLSPEGRPLGAIAEEMKDGAHPKLLGHPEGMALLASKSPISQEMVVSDDVNLALTAWKKSNYSAAVAVIPSSELTPSMMALLAAGKLPLNIQVQANEKGQKLGAGLQMLAEKHQLRPKEVVENSVKNEVRNEVVHTADGGRTQIHVETHEAKHREGRDLDGDGRLDPNEVKRNASDASKTQSVHIERSDGNGNSSSTSASATKGFTAAEVEATEPKQMPGVEGPSPSPAPSKAPTPTTVLSATQPAPLRTPPSLVSQPVKLPTISRDREIV